MKNEWYKEREREIFTYLDKVRGEKNISWAEIIRGLEMQGCTVNRNSAYDWKTGKSNTFMQYIGEICEILEISAENISIINNSGNMINNSANANMNIAENSLSKQEKEIIDIYRNLSLSKQTRFVNLLLELAEQ